MRSIITFLPVLSMLFGCAGGPSLTELRQGTTSVTMVQHGTEPLLYSFGVVDTSSFWAAYGGGVSTQLGGGAVWEGLASSGRADEAKRAPTVAEVMRWLYNNHPLANQLADALIPKYAAVWGQPFNKSRLRVVSGGTPIQDKDNNFIAFNPATDLVLVFEVRNLTLTERQTFGGALAAGFTLGTNTKDVTAQVTVWLEAYKRNAASGKHERVWLSSCGANAMSMPIAFPFPEVVKSREKAKQLWDAAAPLAIKSCSKYFDALIEKERKIAMSG